MKRSTTDDRYTVPTAQDDAARRLSLRYYLICNIRSILIGILIFTILWVALDLLFPRLARAEGTMVQPTGTLTQVKVFPFSTSTALMREGQTGIVKYTIRSVFDRPQTADRLAEIGEYTATEMNPQLPRVDFKFVYADAVEFYQENMSLTITRILDSIRARKLAKDQLTMELYDVDDLIAKEYEHPLEELIHSISQESDAPAEGDEKASKTQPIVAFVTSVDTIPSARQSNTQAVAPTSRTPEFIGVPVQWNASVSDLLRCAADQSSLCRHKDIVSPTILIKNAMFAVIALAQSWRESTLNVEWLSENDPAKMYLAIAPMNTARETELTRLRSIPAVSFRSAWDGPHKLLNIEFDQVDH